MIARTLRNPLATDPCAGRTRPRECAAAAIKLILSIQIHLSLGAPRFLTRQRSRSWARVRRRGCNARSGTGGAGEPGSQAGTRSSPAPRPRPLRRLRRRTRSVRRTWARCGASSWGLKAKPRPTLVDCMRMSKFTAVHEACAACLVRSLSSAQLVHAGRRPPCVRRAGAVHALTHDNAV